MENKYYIFEAGTEFSYDLNISDLTEKQKQYIKDNFDIDIEEFEIDIDSYHYKYVIELFYDNNFLRKNLYNFFAYIEKEGYINAGCYWIYKNGKVFLID